MPDPTKPRKRVRGATITLSKEPSERAGPAEPGREVFALDFRLAMTPDQDLPNLTLLADTVGPVTDNDGKVMGLLVRGAYGGETKKAVTELLSWLESLKRHDHVRLTVLRGGHEPTARVRDATVYEPSVRVGGIGYSLILLADPSDLLETSGLRPAMTEAEWRKRWVG